MPVLPIHRWYFFPAQAGLPLLVVCDDEEVHRFFHVPTPTFLIRTRTINTGLMSAVYKEKLADPKWQRRRLEIFQRDNWTCQCCGNKDKQLEIHHTDYWPGKQPWEYPGDMLITVCHNCHGEEQVRFQYEKDLIKAVRSTGFHAMEISLLAQMIFASSQFRAYLKFSIKKFIEQA